MVPFLYNMYFTYIIYSENRDKYYIGHCADVDKRIEDHNNSRSTYTKVGKPWAFRWKRGFKTRSEAMSEERRIKAKKSRKYIEWLISQDKDSS